MAVWKLELGARFGTGDKDIFMAAGWLNINF